MPVVTLAHDADFDGWRQAARALALAATPAEEVVWQIGERPDSAVPDAAEVTGTAAFSVPRSFIDLAREVVCHSDPTRFGRLYGALLQLRSAAPATEPHPGMARLEDMARDVQSATHAARIAVLAGLEQNDARLVARVEPAHHILRANASFFARRIPSERWSILTPLLSLHRDGERLTVGRGSDLAGDAADQAEAPAVICPLPPDAWKDPAASALPLSNPVADDRVVGVQESARLRSTAGARTATLEALREEAKSCRRCPLWKPATQTVFGEGPVDALLMFVGEQPGDQEDLAGRPFVGPAGQLLDRAFAEAGIDRSRTYVTNAVKHFKFEPRGKRRIHSKPQAPEIDACHWWIDQERMILKPRVTVALGATAARSLLGRVVTIGRTRGQPITLADGSECWVTIHPSYLLRIDDRDRAEQEFEAFVADLKRAAARAAAAQVA